MVAAASKPTFSHLAHGQGQPLPVPAPTATTTPGHGLPFDLTGHPPVMASRGVYGFRPAGLP